MRKKENDILKQAIKVLKKKVGKKCKDWHYGCFICDTYIAISIIENWIDVGKEVE